MNIPLFSEVVKYSRLAFSLRGFLRNTATLEQSKQVITDRLRNRESNFLSLVQKGIYGYAGSPYLKLLDMAGCEYGDIESMVNKDGIETTLRKLLTEGVYLSWEEFKGKKDVIRGGNCYQFKERDFDNPFVAGYYHVQSTGTRSAGTRTVFDLNSLLDRSYYILPMLAANDALDVPIGLWQAEFPSMAGIAPLIYYWTLGKPIARWFSPVTEEQARTSYKHRLATRYIVFFGRLWGAGLVKPEHVSLSQADEVAQWMAETKMKHGGCSLSCFTSPAVKVCQAAMENGLDIKGCHFFVSGEPLTEAKRRYIEGVGAFVTPQYWITEVGPIGFGCRGACAADDVHLFNDWVGFVQHEKKVQHTDAHVNAFVFTTLLPTAPKILLNVESDDYGVAETVNCGCMFEELGFHQHLYNIRSYAKLTGMGMTIVGSDLVRVMEEVLPGRFGGAPTDYQLLEEEDEQGQTRLSVLVNPELGPRDNTDIIETMLRELRRRAGGGKLAAGFWSQAGTLRVKREHPRSKSGKIITLHLEKTA